MLYQFPFETALFITLFDLFLIGLTLGASTFRRVTYKRIAFIFIFLLFCTGSLVKLLGTSPGTGASTPNDLIFQSDSKIETFYLAVADEEAYFIFWKANIPENKGTLTIEMEGTYPTKLRILKKVNGQFRELRPDLTTSGNTYEPISINLDDYRFSDLSKEGEEALKYVWKDNLMNNSSTLVSLLFLISFVWFSFKKTPKTRKQLYAMMALLRLLVYS